MTTAQPVGERPAWVDDTLFPFESRFVEVDGNIVHYVDEGSGPTLLLLHGNPVWAFVYRDVIAALRDRFRCIALDFPGFGLSNGAAGYGYLAEDHAGLLASFVDRLDLSELTMVGHNWGGPIGLHAAQQRPDRFERLVLSNTWAWSLRGDFGSEVFSRGVGNPVGRAVIRRLNLLVEHYIPAGHRRRKLSDAESAHYRNAMATPEHRRACAALPGEIVGAREFYADLANNLGAVDRLPTLIVWADADPIFTERYRQRCEATFPNHTTKVLQGVGHFLQSDAPAEFSAAVDTWMAEQRGEHADRCDKATDY